MWRTIPGQACFLLAYLLPARSLDPSPQVSPAKPLSPNNLAYPACPHQASARGLASGAVPPVSLLPHIRLRISGGSSGAGGSQGEPAGAAAPGNGGTAGSLQRPLTGAILQVGGCAAPKRRPAAHHRMGVKWVDTHHCGLSTTPWAAPSSSLARTLPARLACWRHASGRGHAPGGFPAASVRSFGCTPAPVRGCVRASIVTHFANPAAGNYIPPLAGAAARASQGLAPQAAHQVPARPGGDRAPQHRRVRGVCSVRLSNRVMHMQGCSQAA